MGLVAGRATVERLEEPVEDEVVARIIGSMTCCTSSQSKVLACRVPAAPIMVSTRSRSTGSARTPVAPQPSQRTCRAIRRSVPHSACPVTAGECR
jgi:hypothetical protein